MTEKFHLKRQMPSKRACKKGFSLIEMLMALLVASLLLAALAPVITRKLSEENVSVTNGGLLNERKVCAYINDTFEDIEKDDCIVPSDAHTGSAIIVSGGGGGSGAIDSVKSSVKTLTYQGVSGADNDTTQTQYTMKFNKYVDSMTLHMSGGGGGGGGGNYKSATGAPRKQEDCEPYGVYLPATSGNKALCISKYNAGETAANGAIYTHSEKNASPSSAIAGISNTKTGVACAAEGGCCWMATATLKTGTGCSNINSLPYDPCNRSVCNYDAANTICKAWNPAGVGAGRLPTLAEMEGWISEKTFDNVNATTPGLYNWNAALNTGAQFCDLGSGNPITGSCAASKNCIKYDTTYDKRCYTYLIWHSPDSTDSWFADIGLSSGKFNKSGNGHKDNSFSTRCVVEKAKQFNGYIGGGGGGAACLVGTTNDAFISQQLVVPKQVLSYATLNGEGTIKIYAGAGGKGGAKQSTAKGINGSASRVEIYAWNNELIWAYEIRGGYGGSGASTSAHGTGGAGKAAGAQNSCSHLYKSVAGGTYDNETDINCRLVGGAYEGISGRAGGANENPGKGGGACYNRNTYTDVNSPGYSYGAGGGGGICTIKEDGNVECTDGGNGAAGVVMIKYTTKSPGMGGSGGGAGALLHIVNFETRPGDTIKIKAGKRGSGGGVGAGGLDGGESSITIGSKTYTIAGGKGGKAGTAGVAPVDSTSNATLPKAGNAGEGSKINTTYPGAKFNGGNGTTGIAPLAGDASTSQGGNGGVNPKTALFADIPCGGLSKVAISGAACNRASNEPMPLTRTLTKEDFNSAFKSTYGAGASGGGGGGWNDALTGSTAASSGASGLGGYVFVYFGPW